MPTRFLGALLILASFGLGGASIAGADQPRRPGALVGADGARVAVGCERAQEVVAVVVPEDRFDPGSLVWLAGRTDAPGITVVPAGTTPGEAVALRILVDPGRAAGRTVVELIAAGTAGGRPAEVIDRVAVEVRCTA